MESVDWGIGTVNCCVFQKNGMMEEGGHQDGAINLSTVREAASKEDQHLNGDITHNGENGHDSALPSQPPRVGFLALWVWVWWVCVPFVK